MFYEAELIFSIPMYPLLKWIWIFDKIYQNALQNDLFAFSPFCVNVLTFPSIPMFVLSHVFNLVLMGIKTSHMYVNTKSYLINC